MKLVDVGQEVSVGTQIKVDGHCARPSQPAVRRSGGVTCWAGLASVPAQRLQPDVRGVE